jgi:electron transport complex protein RnfC
MDAPPAPRAQPAADLFGEIQPGEKGSWIEEMRHAGIWADRWGSPDLVAQLHQSLRRPVDTVVCSVLDADRAVPVQSMIADAFGAELAAGVALLAKIAGADRAWIVADLLSPDAFQLKLRTSAESTGARVVPLPNEYPQVDPTLLVHALLQRRLPPDHLPTDAGVLLLDAAAAVAVGHFALAREPMLTVPLAVYDAGSDRTTFLNVPVGTALRDVLEHIGVEAEYLTLRGGPPPRDLRVDPAAVAGGAELTAYVTAPEPDVNPDPCIRCGWCVEGCPVRIHPAGLLEAAQAEDAELADAYGLAACIECGICNYVCPSHLPLLEGIRTLRRRELGR